MSITVSPGTLGTWARNSKILYWPLSPAIAVLISNAKVLKDFVQVQLPQPCPSYGSHPTLALCSGMVVKPASPWSIYTLEAQASSFILGHL